MSYELILADPPWAYNSRCHHSKTRFGGGVHAHYPTMTIKQIRDMPIFDIAARRSILLLWVTGPMLEKAFEIIKAWGFTYKTWAFVWTKLNKKKDSLFFGTGFYFKHNAEICLLATRGKAIKPASDKVSSALLTRLQGHSRKPVESYQRIETCYPDLTKLELFARPPLREGWDYFGNEVPDNLGITLPTRDQIADGQLRFLW